MFLHQGATSFPFEAEPRRDELVVLNAVRYHSLRWGPGAYRAHLEDAARRLEGVEISPFFPGAHTNDPEGYAYMSRFLRSGRREELERDLGLDPEGERDFESEVSGLWMLQEANREALWVPAAVPDYRARVELYFCLVANAYDPFLSFSDLFERRPVVRVWEGALAGSERPWAHDPIRPRGCTVGMPPPTELALCRKRRVERMVERAAEILRGETRNKVSGAEVIRSMRSRREDARETHG